MQLYRVKGNSMYPLITEKDIVLGKEVPFDSLLRGNIVIFKKEKDYLIHRIINKDKNGVIYLRGDGYNLSIETVNKEDVVARAVAIIKEKKVIPLNRFREWISWMVARIKEVLKNWLIS